MLILDRTKLCQSYGAPDCLETPDPDWTMEYEDIGEDPLYFCSNCGPVAASVTETLRKRMDEDPTIAERLQEMMDEISADRKGKAS